MREANIFLGFLFPVFVSLGMMGSVDGRQWTNSTGKMIEAEYVLHSATEVVLSMNGKQVVYPISGLSQADRDFLATLSAPGAATAEAPKTGKLQGLKMTVRLFPEEDDYYKDSDRRTIRKAFEAGAFDDIKLGDPDTWLKRDPEKDTYRIFVPKGYDGKMPYGLLLYINPSDPGSLPEAWLPLCEELKLILVSADNIGNNHPMLRRVQWSMDALANVEKNYRIDASRRVVTGLSGGGHMAMLTAAMYPDYFKGAISNAAQSYLPVPGKGRGHFPGLESTSDFKGKPRGHLKWVVISGNGDKNYQEILDSGKVWEKERLAYRFIDVPGMGHTTAATEPMKEAVEWVLTGG